MTQRALIAGGSLAGLMSGLLLRKAGWEATIFERVAEDLSDRGGGITTQGPLWDVIASAGIDVSHKPGVRLHRRVVFDCGGSILDERPVEEIVTSWDTLYRLLLRAFPAERYHRGRSVEHVEQDRDGVTIRLADGTLVSGDLLIAADGAGSKVRQQFLPEVESVYANYVAWRGLVEEQELEPPAREELVDSFSFCTPPGEQMLSYTIPGPHGETTLGGRRQNFVWYQPAEPKRILPDLLTDAQGQVHRPNISPPLIRPEVIKAMRGHAEAVLTPAYAALVRLTKQPFIQPIADHLSPRFAFGRVVLVGDAAAQARPHVGAGTTKALEDAAALVAALTEHGEIEGALRAYEQVRLESARRMVEHGRWLGRHLDPTTSGGGEDQAPGTLLQKTARPGSAAAKPG